MKIKSFVGRDYQDAIRQAKQDMGNDAIILHTRQVKKPGLRGLFTHPQVEVTMAIDDTLRVNMDRLRDMLPLLLQQQAEANGKAVSIASSGIEESLLLEEMQKMKLIISEIKSKMCEVEILKGMREPVQEFFHTLVSNNVDKEIALKIVTQVEARLPRDEIVDPEWALEVCLHTIQDCFPPVQPISVTSERKGNLVFLVGPTGVGKTTTIAKLAANMTFAEQKNVALVTLDTYRVAAVEQLKTFAEIMDIAISVVYSPSELSEALHQFAYNDYIFVDTAGRSPYNYEHLEELRQFVATARPQEVILVLSATTPSSELSRIYHKFNTIGIDKLIFTKLDETSTFGQLLNAAHEVQKPIAYITNGQNVPDDIAVPDTWDLAQMLLRKDEAL
ncbi:MAG TPA: flagellar biosynthesis protein FlhF [Syntrophomonadaceae bacterium]|nr:flagellar biosynthesis protein FlhF [Syntrophomonadaceae bacterium]